MSEAAEASAIFDRTCEAVLTDYPQDERGRMLHSPGLKTRGKFYAFLAGDDLIVKLPEARVQALIADGLGRPCSPRPGRPMREWVELPGLTEVSCLSYALEARAFVAGAKSSQ